MLRLIEELRNTKTGAIKTKSRRLSEADSRGVYFLLRKDYGQCTGKVRENGIPIGYTFSKTYNKGTNRENRIEVKATLHTDKPCNNYANIKRGSKWRLN